MRASKGTILALGLLLLGLVALPASAGAGTPNLVGTWEGTAHFAGSGAGSPDYGTATVRLVVADQSGRLIRGTCVRDPGGLGEETLGLTGVITGRRVAITTYDLATDEPTQDLYDLTHYPRTRTLRGTLRSMHAVSGFVSLKKQ